MIFVSPLEQIRSINYYYYKLTEIWVSSHQIITKHTCYIFNLTNEKNSISNAKIDNRMLLPHAFTTNAIYDLYWTPIFDVSPNHFTKMRFFKYANIHKISQQ